MHLPPLQSPSTTGFYVSGDVAIAEDAVIAPGAVLRADPGCSIVVGSGVLVGLGAVIHAVGGTIALESNANLGAGVLIVGCCRVGTSACVGASATLHNANIAPGQLVMPGSLLGGTASGQTQGQNQVQTQPQTQPQGFGTQASGARSTFSQNSASQSFTSPSASPWDDEQTSAGSLDPDRPLSPPAESSQPANAHSAKARPSQAQPSQETEVPKVVYGKEQFNQIRMMFSQRAPNGSNGSTS